MSRSWSGGIALFASACTFAWASTQHTVDQRDRAFSQPAITVKAGDTVKVVNRDEVTHSLFAKNELYDIRETQAPGAESTFTFDKVGTVVMRCAIHPQMALEVTVTP